MGLSFEKLREDSRNSRTVENERETSRMRSSKKSFGHSVPGRAIKTRHVTECARQAGAPLSFTGREECVCMCVCVCVCVCGCGCVYVWLCVSVCMCGGCTRVYACVRVCVSVCMCGEAHVCVGVCECVYVCDNPQQ